MRNNNMDCNDGSDDDEGDNYKMIFWKTLIKFLH